MPSLAVMFATQVAMAVEQWRGRNGPALGSWLEAWAEFEALNALAVVALDAAGHLPFFRLSLASMTAISSLLRRLA